MSAVPAKSDLVGSHRKVSFDVAGVHFLLKKATEIYATL